MTSETSEQTPAERLDAANRAVFRKHYRRILDLGLGDGPSSALPGILADLRANAEQYAQTHPGNGAAPKRTSGRS